MNNLLNTPQQQGETSRTDVILTPGKAALFCLIVWFVYLCTLKRGFELWDFDSFAYLTLAKSLISEGGYSILGIPHTRFPFGFPCLLAPVVGIFGYNFLVVQIFLITLAVLALFVCFIFLRRSYNGKLADMAFLLTGISYPFWFFNCNLIISEIPYLLVSLLTLIAAQKYFKKHTHGIQDSILLALLILASYFTRVVGVSLLAAVIVLGGKELIKRHKGSFSRLCVILIICGSAILFWYVREKMLATPTYIKTMHTRTYKHEFEHPTPVDMMAGLSDRAKALIRIKYHLINHARDITSTITSIRELSFNLRFWWCFICLIFILGFLYSLFKRGTVVEWYLLFYIGIFVVWPVESVRFWYPIMPFIFFYFLKAIYLIKEKLSTERGKRHWWRILFLILLFSGYFLVFVPLSETQSYERGLIRYYQIIVTFVFVTLYFLMVTISFIFAFCSENIVFPFTKKSLTVALPHIWKIIFAIVLFHNLSMLTYRTHLKHQDYGLRIAGKLYFHEMGQWLRQNSNKSDIVMCDDPMELGVFSERSCTLFPEAIETQSIIDRIREEKVRYVLVKSNKTSLLTNLREIEVFHKLNFKEILQSEGNLLFKIEPPFSFPR